jgi:ABC-type sugar transport system ATPase subunit
MSADPDDAGGAATPDARAPRSPALRTTGLAVRRGERTVLRDVDLELARGEVLVVLGPNGAGKSTLLAAVAGLLPASAGTIERDGRVAAALQAPALARRSVRANLSAALGWWGVPRGQRTARIDAALAALRAQPLADRLATTLSGGEARRVHLARAIALQADVLLLDEPFAGLDAVARADLLYDAASALRHPDRATLVIVHDRAEAWALADRVLVVLDGTVAAAGTPAEVLEHPPTAPVARFLGFDGELADAGADGRGGAGRLLTRPAHVTLDPDGPLTGRVARRVPTEEGVRLHLELDAGTLTTIVPLPGPQAGDPVRVRIDGGLRFPE